MKPCLPPAPSHPPSSILSKQGYGPSAPLAEPALRGSGAGSVQDRCQTPSPECDGALPQPLLQRCCPACAHRAHGAL